MNDTLVGIQRRSQLPIGGPPVPELPCPALEVPFDQVVLIVIEELERFPVATQRECVLQQWLLGVLKRGMVVLSPSEVEARLEQYATSVEALRKTIEELREQVEAQPGFPLRVELTADYIKDQVYSGPDDE